MRSRRVYLVWLGLLVVALMLSAYWVFQDRLDLLKRELTTAQSEIENLQSDLASLRSQFETMQSGIASPGDGTRLPSGLAVQSAKLTKLPDAKPEEQVAESENKLEVLLNSTVMRDFKFEIYNRGTYQWTFTIPLLDYFYYKEKPRPTPSLRYGVMTTEERYYYFSQYMAMAFDVYDDALIESIVNNVNEIAVAENLSERDKLNLVLQFIQNLPYTEDAVATPYFEYPRYPIETLFDPGGDCEDTSILATAILTKMGYEVALILFEEFDHMGVGITYDLQYGNSWIYDEKTYWYLDTTGGWSLGWAPAEYAQTPAYVYPVIEK